MSEASSDPHLDVLSAAETWCGEGRGVALATVVETWGSAPRPVGSHLVVDEKGNFEGSVSGGCVEGAVVGEALDVIASGKPRMLEFVRAGGGARVLRARAEALPLGDGVARLVAFAQSLHWTAIDAALSEAARVVARPGAILVTWMSWPATGERVEALYAAAWEASGRTRPSRRSGHPPREHAEERLAAAFGALRRWSAPLRMELGARELGRFLLSREETACMNASERLAFGRRAAECAAKIGTAVRFELGVEARLALL